jgi:hypothetical protein
LAGARAGRSALAFPPWPGVGDYVAPRAIAQTIMFRRLHAVIDYIADPKEPTGIVEMCERSLVNRFRDSEGLRHSPLELVARGAFHR